MLIGILNGDGGLGGYVHEMLRTWGLTAADDVGPDALATLDPAATPVLIVPAGVGDAQADDIAAFARRGGSVVACLPSAALIKHIGVAHGGELETPLRLRMSAMSVAGLSGELLPVVGKASLYQPGETTVTYGHLSGSKQWHDLGPGVFETPLGAGRLIVVAFDLPLCVMLCRQGDPKLADQIPTDAGPGNNGARAVYMAVDIGVDDASWHPHADMMARLLVELARRSVPGPAPMLWHLPDRAAAIVLYSGDEDWAALEETRDQMESVRAGGGRMNLYIIPENTKSTRDTALAYLQHHNLGPHPNLRHLDRTPLAQRIAEFERQVRLFEEKFGVRARSVRNHCVVWPGYTDLPEAMQRLGIRMDGNYNYGSYHRRRDPGPYAGWGAAMPMYFCRTDGRTIPVFQQHTHVGDDETFSTLPQTDYSYRLSPEVYAVMARRILGDSVQRFHMPYAVNIHPSNWARFSGEQSASLLAEAARLNVPVWSFDQWLDFCEMRHDWRMTPWAWDGRELRWTWAGTTSATQLSGMLPLRWRGLSLASLSVNGRNVPLHESVRHHEPVAMFDVPNGASRAECVASYHQR